MTIVVNGKDRTYEYNHNEQTFSMKEKALVTLLVYALDEEVRLAKFGCYLTPQNHADLSSMLKANGRSEVLNWFFTTRSARIKKSNKNSALFFEMRRLWELTKLKELKDASLDYAWEQISPETYKYLHIHALRESVTKKAA